MRLFRNKIVWGLSLALVMSSPSQSWGRDADPVKITGGAAVKGANQVVVGAFNIGFIFESVDQTKATGGLIGAFGGATRAKSKLVGVTPEMMQAITDAAYADFLGKLTAQGFALQSPETLFSHATMANPHAQHFPFDVNLTLDKGSKGKVTYYKPTALPLLVMIGGDFISTGLGNIGIMMSSGQAGAAMSTFANQTGVSVIDVTYLVDFSNQQRPGAFSMRGIEVNSGISVAADYSRMSLIAPHGKTATFTVGTPVAVEGDFITRRGTTSGTSKGVQAAANVASGVAAGLFGGGGMMFGKSREFEFDANPVGYPQGVQQAASLADDRLLAQLVALR